MCNTHLVHLHRAPGLLPRGGDSCPWGLGWSHDPRAPCFYPLQVLRYFDYVFTGVFTFEMVIKVSAKGFCSLKNSPLAQAGLEMPVFEEQQGRCDWKD